MARKKSKGPISKGGRNARGGRSGMGRRSKGFRLRRISVCRFCKDKTKEINYKNVQVLERMVNERGKMLSRRITGNCAKHQRRVARAIRRARYLSLIPYVK